MSIFSKFKSILTATPPSQSAQLIANDVVAGAIDKVAAISSDYNNYIGTLDEQLLSISKLRTEAVTKRDEADSVLKVIKTASSALQDVAGKASKNVVNTKA